MRTRVSLSVVSTDPQAVARAIEHFARTAAGLALDGLDAVIVAGPEDDEP